MLNREELMTAAKDATGLDDFGDSSYEEALNRLIKSYNEEADLSEIGLYVARHDLINDLAGRLWVVDGLKKVPQALETDIVKPIFILGFPRTGTTTLHNMIQANPDCQVLEHWLALAPRPRPPKQQWPDIASYQQVAEALRLQYEANPDLRAQHDISADSADECRFVLRQLFLDDSYGYVCNLPSYRQWFEQQPMKAVYEWHRDVLKLIQHPNDANRRWVLKYPSHLACIKEIFQVYPDACIIQTHRDPVATIPSFTSLVAGAGSTFSNSMDPRSVGQFMAEHWHERVETAMRCRDELQREDQFYDVQFDEVLSDPVKSIQKAFEKFGVKVSALAETNMRTWQQNHPPDRHGSHSYTAEDFGLDSKALSERFRSYRDKYKVASLKI
jgi:hypothetical protein